MDMEMFMIIGILTGSMIVLLKHWPLLLLQVIYLIMAGFTDGLLFVILFIGQILFGFWILYRLFMAVDYDYTLQMDQIEVIPQKYTKGGKLGRKRNFSFLDYIEPFSHHISVFSAIICEAKYL
ncbi:hypothetical protein [Gracilibacillus sp. JCM 18860]|uniref:hypothetical protein n=1 Tax=Gracilibacillus sp. JCM 18860 TaxID=1306159 RepID=UPI0006D0EF89